MMVGLKTPERSKDAGPEVTLAQSIRSSLYLSMGY
jgi:hypothetical protein